MSLLTAPSDILAANLRREMAARRMSQSELARVSGVHQPSISRILAGMDNVTIGTVGRLADALGLSIAILFMPVDDALNQSA